MLAKASSTDLLSPRASGPRRDILVDSHLLGVPFYSWWTCGGSSRVLCAALLQDCLVRINKCLAYVSFFLNPFPSGCKTLKDQETPEDVVETRSELGI